MNKPAPTLEQIRARGIQVLGEQLGIVMSGRWPRTYKRAIQHRRSGESPDGYRAVLLPHLIGQRVPSDRSPRQLPSCSRPTMLPG